MGVGKVAGITIGGEGPERLSLVDPSPQYPALCLDSWFSRCVFQDRGQELVDGLKVCLQGGSVYPCLDWGWEKWGL